MNMDEMIKALYEMTIEMNRSLDLDNMDQVMTLLNNRNDVMMRIEARKTLNEHHQYTEKEKQWLKEILRIDQLMAPQLEKNMTETKVRLNVIKKSKQVSKSYQPYIQQTNGVFLDRKK